MIKFCIQSIRHRFLYSFYEVLTITVESYIGKVGGKEGVKLEQQYLVGENGLELMSHHPLEDI